MSRWGSALNGSFVLRQAGTGILTVSSNNSAYPPGDFYGSVVVLSGGLSISSDNNLKGAPIALKNATTLYTTASGTYTSPVTVTGAGAAFNVGTGITTTWSGRIADGTSAGELQVTGGGTLTLTNSGNSYSGGTIVKGGSTLQITADSNLGASSGGIALGDASTAGTLVIKSSTTGTRSIVLGPGGGTIGLFAGATVEEGGVISGSGGLTTAGGGKLVVTANESYTGGTTINGGTLQLGNGGTTGSIMGNVGGFGSLSFNRSDTVIFGGVVSGNFWLQQDGAGTTILTGANTNAFGTIVNAGKLQLGPGGTLGNSSLTINGGTLDLNNTNQTVGAATGLGGFITLGSGTLTVTGNNGGALASVISGTGGIQVSAGQLKLAADNTYTGGTVISGTGTLQIGNGGTTGSVLGDITNNSQLVFNRSDTFTFSNVASGSGRLLHFGTGRLILTGTNTYTGGTEVDFGTLQIGNGGTTGSIVGNVIANGGGIAFDRSDNVAFGGSISGNVAQIGSGTLTLTGVSPINGNIRISQGSLIIGAGGGITSSNNFLILSGTGNFYSDTSVSLRDLSFTGSNSTIAVATGQTMNFNLSLSLTGTGSITFGSPARAGTIAINASSPSVGGISVRVAGGTLRDVTSSPNSSGGGAFGDSAWSVTLHSRFGCDSGSKRSLRPPELQCILGCKSSRRRSGASRLQGLDGNATQNHQFRGGNFRCRICYISLERGAACTIGHQHLRRGDHHQLGGHASIGHWRNDGVHYR
jgi:autotransporter-associated beta strand protein